jgi:LmbE family N-acetylglucosaminyl deacetylase
MRSNSNESVFSQVPVKIQRIMAKNNRRLPLASIFVVFALAFSLASGLDISRARAQEPSPAPTPTTQTVNKAELHQALLDLTNQWTVMCVAAHPDDEDGTTLTVLRRRDGVHTVSLFSTYGEGGQNAVGPELYEELGVIRAQETMKAAQIQGSEPYFLGLKDFGFSKSADEAFKVWGHEEALRRMVQKIRELRPDVIITNHDTTSGHGHHQATGRLIIEAFDAAADPKRFPEQLNKLQPWQAQRLFVRVFGGATAQKPNPQGGPEKIIAIDPNEIDPVRGTSFAEQALAALQQHATQGPWPKSMAELLKARRIEAGKLPLIRYRLLREATGAPPLPESTATPLAGLKLTETFAARVAPPKIDGRPLTDFLDRPDRVLASLIDWRASQSGHEPSTEDPDRFHLFEARANRSLAIASGVSLTLNSRAAVLVPGQNTTFSINIANAGLSSVHVDELRFDSWGEGVRPTTADELLPDTETVVTVDRTTPKNATLTVPKEEHLYDNLFLGQSFQANADVEIDGAKFSVSTATTRDVAPAIEIKSIAPSPYVWTAATLNQPLSFKVTVTNNLDAPFNGNLTIGNPQYHIFEAGRKFSLAPTETREVTFKSNAVPMDTSMGRRRTRSNSGLLFLSIEAPDSRRPITQRSLRMVYADARVGRGLRVGFVPSFDQTLQRSLAALGVDAQELSVADIQKGELSGYQTIVIDNRGYEAHPELIAANSRLLEFVNAGGTLLVFYHKSNEWNPDPNKHRPQLAPYPIVLGDERVTDETAPIKFLLPRHPLLNIPNRITQADFANWIQERGLYYPKEWDPHYSALFSTNDPGEAPLKGGLLVAQYGKGAYIYTSMVWYRELRAGVPGAYGVFANMISYGHP